MTSEVKPQNKGTKQLFKNPILEKLSRTHISVPLIIFFVYAATLLYWNTQHTSLNMLTTILLFVVGLLSFTWVEYMVHRHVFHMKTYTQLREKIQYTMHGVHHEFPKDKDRLAMPPLLSITIATVLLLIFKVLMGDFVFAFLPGFLVGYASYLSVHYMVHAYAPPKNIFKALWVNHSVHHYKDGEVVFGVSSPLWDYIYGTMKLKDSKSAKDSHGDLGVA
jgi:sterol desaturase/sphingolipid hydroxylase (fatty acid hydroxylase superfamily)